FRPFQRTPVHPRYRSWIRYGQIEASAHNQYPATTGSLPSHETNDDEAQDNGTIISEALSWAKDYSVVRPDVLHDFGLDHTKTRISDTLLNSLCQFDFLYAWLVNAAATAPSGGGAFPASS